MTDFIVSLVGGVALIAAVFILINRYSKLSGKATAVLMALIVTGTYVPYSILNWQGADVFAIHIAIYLVCIYVLGIISSQWESKHHEAGRKFHWAPAMIVAFFVVVVTIDSVFIMLAQKGVDSELARMILPAPEGKKEVTSYFPGTTTHAYQEREAEFNALVERIEKQEKRNWQIKKGWLNTPIAGKSAIFKLELKDAEAKEIDNAVVEGEFTRPGNMKLDQTFNMQEVAPGVYQAAIVLPEPGNWTLVLHIRKDDILHELTARTDVSKSQP